MEDAENADINRAKPEAAYKCVALECAMRRPLCRQSSYRCTQTRGLPPDKPHPLPTPRSLPEALLAKVREELTCVICMDLTTRPSTLPCGHTACRRCLNRAPTMGEPEPQKRCPSCRAPMPAGMPPLALSTTLKSLAELLLPGERCLSNRLRLWVLGAGRRRWWWVLLPPQAAAPTNSTPAASPSPLSTAMSLTSSLTC